MLDVDRRIYIDARGQKLLNILVPLAVAAGFRIGVGKLINQDKLRRAFHRLVQIKLTQLDSLMLRLERGDLLQPV